MPKETTLCIVAANGLGDALVQMVLASNLARAGFKVSFFSDIASSLDDKVSDYQISKFPPYYDLLATLQGFEVVLYDSSGAYVRGMPQDCEQWCIDNAICYRMSDAEPRHKSITVEKISGRLPGGNAILAKKLKGLNRALRGRYSGLDRPPVITQLTETLKEIGFENVVVDNGLQIAKKQSNSKKIILHPTSSSDKKNWPLENYVELYKWLKSLDLKPVITVAPSERPEFVAEFGEELVPVFNSIAELAEFYADGAFFIGGDSGNAHLASCLGVDTLQLFRGYKKAPAWRAGWGNNTVVIPSFPFNILKSVWHLGTRPKRVMSILEGEFRKNALI